MPASYAWMISYDHISEPGEPAPSNSNAKGMIGPYGADPVKIARLVEAIGRGRKHASEFPDVEWFKIYDDDGEVYYTGVRMGEAEEFGSEEGFKPLDDFGTPNAGAVPIDYLNVAKSAEA